MPPGARLNFWRYCTRPRTWGGRSTASGQYTRNGKQVGLPESRRGNLSSLPPRCSTRTTLPPPDEGLLPAGGRTRPRAPDPPSGGEPVDLGTGLFVLTQTELSLPDVVPIILTPDLPTAPTPTRGRSASDQAIRMKCSFRPAIRRTQDADLVLADGARVHYVRNSPAGHRVRRRAVFEHTTTASRFLQLLSPDHFGIVTDWTLTLKDGGILFFGENAPAAGHCGSATAIRSHSSAATARAATSRRSSPPNGPLAHLPLRRGKSNHPGDGQHCDERCAIAMTRAVAWQQRRVPSGGLTDYTYDDTSPADPMKKTRMLTQKDARRDAVPDERL